ncbi:lytic enzyme [Caulobacter phage Cr30]|uniref:endolysin n=1 Tax=Caulobacter phage Cr30 TaxID=1357714 RepID=UPI0004A9B934|nr:endolysin [Caulobacter phage Cr30]AGS81164.1 lytic enzyme [Caulobacter phage Cr30]
MITPGQFAQCFPEISSVKRPEIYSYLVKYMTQYEILKPIEQAQFLAQCGHECASFSSFSENLNYSAEALRKVFGKYFPTDALANQYARKPQAIANRVYANRMGNGDEKSGDGWTFRGAGAIQQTGRKNIGAFALATGRNILQAAEYLRTTEGAVEGAAYYWKINNLNRFASDVVACSGYINTGSSNAKEASIHGILDRKNRFAKYKKVLNA